MRTRTTYQAPATTAGQLFRSTFRNALTGGLVVAATLITLVGVHPAYEAPTATQSTYWQGGPGFTVGGDVAPIVRDGYEVDAQGVTESTEVAPGVEVAPVVEEAAPIEVCAPVTAEDGSVIEDPLTYYGYCHN